MAQIIVTIDSDGGSQVEVKGVAGPKCVEMTAGLEKALGRTVRSRRTFEHSLSSKTETEISVER